MTSPDLVFVIPWSLDERTGGTIYDARVIAGLRRRGWDVTVLSLGGRPSESAAALGRALSGALARLPDGARVVIDGLVMAEGTDAVRSQRSRLGILALVHQVVGDASATEPSHHARIRAAERDALSATHGVIVTSGFSARRVAEIGVDAARVRTVPPGTDPAAPAVGPGPGLPPRLLCVAAVTPGKGQDVLVRSLRRLADASWTCVLAGDVRQAPAFVAQIRALLDDAGLAGRVKLAGTCDEAQLDALYRSSSVFVLASRYEAYGMALTEAMAHGLPVVTTTAGAIPETVPSAAAILVPPGDDAALAGALRELITDATADPGSASRRRSALGAASTRHAAGLPAWEQCVEAFAEAITALLGSPAQPTRAARS